MHIKQVIIEGFKTYKDRTAIDPFHKGHNVICMISDFSCFGIDFVYFG